MKKNNSEVKGNTEGMRKSSLIALSAIYEGNAPELISYGAVEVMCGLTARYSRELCVVTGLKGKVESVSAGDFATAPVSVPAGRGGAAAFAVIHTHPGGDPTLSAPDLLLVTGGGFALAAAVAVTDEGAPGRVCAAAADFSGAAVTAEFNEYNPAALLQFLKEVKSRKDGAVKPTRGSAPAPERERALLIAVESHSDLTELKLLTRSAGAEVAGELTQNRSGVSGATLLGSGKLREAALLLRELNADLVISDNELSGVQIRNLEAALGVKVIDRSMLILDIFASRAKSLEGKLQVELAQLKYSLPRLIGVSGKMDKMRSGIGMRGPGEKKLETDRRLIKREVFELEKRIEKLKEERALRRERRAAGAMKSVALVGYTNAGKSTVLNALAKSDVLAEDKLFATLDPVTRKVYAGGQSFLLTDTVGFINKLPSEFIDAFAGTLEEARQADLLLHIMDVSDANLDVQNKVVNAVLEKLGIMGKPVINVYNKADKLTGVPPALPENMGGVIMSAKNPDDTEKLKNMILEKLSESREE